MLTHSQHSPKPLSMASPMRDRWRAFVEWLLPWYDPAREARRDRRTESIRRYSIGTRIRSERLIDEYRAAAAGHTTAGERLIDEIRRGDDA